jgi:hypothetical protein
VRGPDGKPRVIRRGIAAFAALQANIPKVLRIGIIQGARIVEERIVRQRETITVGQSERNHFVIPHPGLAGRHPLFELRPGPKGDQYFLTFTDDMSGRVAFPATEGGVVELAALKASPRAFRGPRGYQVPVSEQVKGRLVIGDTTMLFQFVVPPPIQPRPQLPASVRGGWLDRMDPFMMVSILLSSIAHVALMCVTMIPDWPKPTLEDILASDYSPNQLVQPEVEEFKPPEETGDEGKPTEDGTGTATGAETTTTTETVAGPAQPTVEATGPRSTGPNPNVTVIGGERISTRALDGVKQELVNTFSAENSLAGEGGIGPEMGIGGDFDGSSAAVTGLGEAMQGTAGVGEGDGAGGGYTTATGQYGSGPAVGSGIGTGPGTGPVGPAVVPSGQDAKVEKKVEVKIKGKIRFSGASHAGGSGRWSGDIFRAKLDRKRGAIQGCYDAALARDPTLAGDLTFLLTVNQQGTVAVDVQQNAPVLQAAGVTDCIVGKLRSLNFTDNPPQGGDTRVRLPFSFIAP